MDYFDFSSKGFKNVSTYSNQFYLDLAALAIASDCVISGVSLMGQSMGYSSFVFLILIP